MAIDVFFTGLMLICLDGHKETCPVKQSQRNTAWVVKAYGPTPCGWEEPGSTEFSLRFLKEDFDPIPAFCETETIDTDVYIKCAFQEGDICVQPTDTNGSPLPEPESSPGDLKLPRLDVDPRLWAFSNELLMKSIWVPYRINFPRGDIIKSDAPWYPKATKPTQWYHSNGGPIGALSDRLVATYNNAAKLRITDCQGKPLLTLTPKAGRHSVEFRNYSKIDPAPMKRDSHEDLTYFLWYYRLGEWRTAGGNCPEYTHKKWDAILPRCERNPKCIPSGPTDPNCDCSYSPIPRSDHRFWPVMLGF